MKKPLLLILILLCAALPLLIQTSYASTPAGTITYSGATDTITVVGANSSHPAEFLDLYNADLSGGWGQIAQQATNQYAISCFIVIGNGTSAGATYFTETGKQVLFASGVSTSIGQTVFSVTAYSTATFGTLDSETGKLTSNGCSFLFMETTYRQMVFKTASSTTGTIYFYSCTFSAPTYGSYHLMQYISNLSRIWNCQFIRAVSLTDFKADMYNDLFQKTTYPISSYSGTSMSDIRCSNITTASIYHYSAGTVYNLFTRGSPRVAWITSNNNLSLVNPDCDVWAFGNWGTYNATVFRQYTFNIFVLNGALTDFVENANVTLTHDGIVYGSWLANSTGQIPTQTLTYGFYNQTGGNTMYGGTAWTLTISHPDWQTYTSTFYPYSKIEWSISMQDTSTTNNNLLLSGLFVGVLCFAGFIVYMKRN